MPVLDEAVIKSRRAVYNDGGVGTGLEAMKLSNGSGGANLLDGVMDNHISVAARPAATMAAPKAAAPSSGGSNFLLDLDDIFGGGGGGGAPAPPPVHSYQPQQNNTFPPAAPIQQTPTQSHDLLSDIFSAQPQPQILQQSVAMPLNNGFDGLGGLSVSAPIVSPQAAATVSPGGSVIKAFEKNGFVVMMEISKPNPGDLSMSRILCKFTNQSQMPITNLSFQVYF